MDQTFSSMFDIIGLFGVGFYVAAYAALQIGLVRGTGYIYILLNLAAASFVLVSLTNDFNLSSAIIQITWIAISLFGLSRTFLLLHSTHLTAEEAEFAKSKTPGLTKPSVRKFFDAGLWVEYLHDTDVTTEGAPLSGLIYLQSGSANVSLGGNIVGQLHGGAFVGELTCFDGGPTTASVTIAAGSRVFRISTDALNALCKRNEDLKSALESAMRSDTRTKLVAANQMLNHQNKITATI
ncbi:cyclic nucleotide-binding domain-containing protein [uncultured Sulfitobacter sp.]|uniref:cyclic nucleotide-binding domain-containing protein n=1 Tax=uncultured Sulfitobacter sp. TaxID=191468 RepID=UPI00261C1536|nr:cyclic nucleotide-binding domain-containing protein [uncultured Sulfitobacter sp.]